MAVALAAVEAVKKATNFGYHTIVSVFLIDVTDHFDLSSLDIPDILICGNCKEMFTALNDIIDHKKNYCKLRFACKCGPRTNYDIISTMNKRGKETWQNKLRSFCNFNKIFSRTRTAGGPDLQSLQLTSRQAWTGECSPATVQHMREGLWRSLVILVWFGLCRGSCQVSWQFFHKQLDQRKPCSLFLSPESLHDRDL